MSKLLFVSCALLAASSLFEETAMDYPNAQLLIEPAELMGGKAQQMRIVDVRAADAYRQGHIPGAVRVDSDLWTARSRQPGGLEDARIWSDLIGSLGITSDTPVVVYDETVTPAAARIWWLMRYAGHRDVRLLNGGLSAWRAAGGTISRAEPNIKPSTFEPRFQKQMLADRSLVRELIGRPDSCVVDARSTAEYTGRQVQGPRGGRVPGARHLEWTALLDSRGRLKPAAELGALLAKTGIDTDQTAITYCQSGGRAALDAFVLELMGAKEVKNYYGSWAEWSAHPELPVEK